MACISRAFFPFKYKSNPEYNSIPTFFNDFGVKEVDLQSGKYGISTTHHYIYNVMHILQLWQMKLGIITFGLRLWFLRVM